MDISPTLCRVLFWVFLLTSQFYKESSAVITTTEQTGGCSTHTYLDGKGSFTFPTDEDCSKYKYEILSSDRYSIISVSLTSTSVVNVPEGSKEASGTEILVLFTESASSGSGTEESCMETSWILTPQTKTDNRDYLSRTSRLRIDVTVTGNWLKGAVNVTYEEIKLEAYSNGSKSVKGEVTPWISMKGRTYRPNCVALYLLGKSPNMNVSSIAITLHYLDIDYGVGEYLLIGAGQLPFEGPPPLMIANESKKKKYKVNDENAYIVFVSGPTRKVHSGFRISWQHSGTKIKQPQDDRISPRGDDVLQSVPVCIYNKTAALVEFSKSEEMDSFREFRVKLAEIASEYARNKTLNSDISASKVRLFRVSGYIPESTDRPDLEDGALYVMVKVVGNEEGKTAFTWRQLKEIVRHYDKYYAKTENGYKVAKCPADEVWSSPWWSIGLYAIVPVFCAAFIVLWMCRHKLVSQSHAKKKEKSRNLVQAKSSQDVTASLVGENEYVTAPHTRTLPKVLLTTDQGRRFTLDFNHVTTNYTTDDSDIDIFNRMDFKKMHRRKSSVLESRSERTKRKLKHSAVNYAFQHEDQYPDEIQQGSRRPEPLATEGEHVYDSVMAERSTCKSDDAAETKL